MRIDLGGDCSPVAITGTADELILFAEGLEMAAEEGHAEGCHILTDSGVTPVVIERT